MVERLNVTIRERNKVMRGLEDEPTAQTIIDRFRICYNFIRKHQSLNGKTPAQKATLGNCSNFQNHLGTLSISFSGLAFSNLKHLQRFYVKLDMDHTLYVYGETRIHAYVHRVKACG